MIEQLLTLTSQKVVPSIPPILLYDPVTNTDLTGNSTIVTNGSPVIDDSVKFYGFSTATWNENTGVFLTFKDQNILNLYNSDWTYEYEIQQTEAPTNYKFYYWDVLSNSSIANGGRSTDSGYGFFRQFGINGFGASDNSQMWRIQGSQSSLVGTPQQIALVCRDKVISIYVNGVRQALASGTGSAPSFNTFSYPCPSNAGYLRQVRHGYLSAQSKGVASKRGRIRVSNYARYLSNYTPKALTL